MSSPVWFIRLLTPFRKNMKNSRERNPKERNILFYLDWSWKIKSLECSSFPSLTKNVYSIVKSESEVPKSKVPKSRPKGLGLTLKSHGLPPEKAILIKCQNMWFFLNKSFPYKPKLKMGQVQVLRPSACILEHSRTFWNILEHSGPFWTILEYSECCKKVEFQLGGHTDTHTHTHTDRRH